MSDLFLVISDKISFGFLIYKVGIIYTEWDLCEDEMRCLQCVPSHLACGRCSGDARVILLLPSCLYAEVLSTIVYMSISAELKSNWRGGGSSFSEMLTMGKRT